MFPKSQYSPEEMLSLSPEYRFNRVLAKVNLSAVETKRLCGQEGLLLYKKFRGEMLGAVKPQILIFL